MTRFLDEENIVDLAEYRGKVELEQLMDEWMAEPHPPMPEFMECADCGYRAFVFVKLEDRVVVECDACGCNFLTDMQ